MKIPILSICIPTFKRVDVVRETIRLIYEDSVDVDFNDFEVVVSDNDPECESRCFVDEFKYPNFRYIPTDCEGFLNSYYALTYGKGVMLKLHNNRDHMKPGMLKYIINRIKSVADSKPALFFTNGNLGYKSPKEFKTADEFLYSLSYYSSWSSGFNIWREDFDKIKDTVKIDKMFPQTSLLFATLDRDKFMIDDIRLYKGSGHKEKKLRYNPIYVFGVEYVDLVKGIYEDGIISKRTFNKIRKETLKNYLALQYFKSKILRKNEIEYIDIRKNLNIHYGRFGWLKLVGYTLIAPLTILRYKN